MKQAKFYELWLNRIELAGILLVLMGAFTFQFILHELPCPLCLLQRLGFIGMAVGLCMNLRFGFRPSHYAMTLLSAAFTACVALRQISLHIIPGTGHYGSAIFGWHLYTWSFVVAAIVIVFTTIILSIDRQYVDLRNTKPHWRTIGHVLLIVAFLLALGNGISTYMECGIDFCPENPTKM